MFSLRTFFFPISPLLPNQTLHLMLSFLHSSLVTTNSSITLTPKHNIKFFIYTPSKNKSNPLSNSPSLLFDHIMSFLVLILLFLSTLHAYDARHLGFHTENFALIKLKASHLDTQDVKKTWLLDISSSTHQAERIAVKKRSDQKMSPSEIDTQEEIKIEGAKRLMMEDASNDTVKVVNNSEENEVGEDMVVMDYAQPHRKPPIHNEKP